MNKLIFYILLILSCSISLFSVEENKSRLIIFENIGQREEVNINDRISVVYGKNIKTEYVYLNYIQGKTPNKFYIELKSIEPFLKDISKLNKYIDSLENELGKTASIDTIFIEKDQNKAIENPNQVELKDKTLDSLINVTDTPLEQNFITKMPKIKNLIDAVDFIRKQNKSKITNNDLEIKKIDTQIDSISSIIGDANEKGLSKSIIDKYLKEIELLKLKKKEIQLMNEQLSLSNQILEKELIARNAEYDALMRLIYIMILVILLIIVISIAIYYNYYQKKKYNKQLSEINDQLEIINKQLLKSNLEKENLIGIIKGELNLASKYVTSLLPVEYKDENINAEWIFQPSEELGGDSFGYHYIDDENFAMYLLDVSGHGVGAALHSVQVLNILQNSTLPNVDFKKPEEVLNALNKIFQMNHYSGLYFTIFYAVYNVKTRTLCYSAAGHPPMLLAKKDKLINLESQNIFIGAIKNLNYTSDSIIIDKQDVLYLFSDGVFELIDSQQKVWTFEDFTLRMDKYNKAKNTSLQQIYQDNIKISDKNILDDDFSFVKFRFLK